MVYVKPLRHIHAPHLDIDVDLLKRNVAKTNAQIRIIPLSSKTGEGLDGVRECVAGCMAERFAEVTVKTGLGDGRVIAWVMQ